MRYDDISRDEDHANAAQAYYIIARSIESGRVISQFGPYFDPFPDKIEEHQEEAEDTMYRNWNRRPWKNHHNETIRFEILWETKDDAFFT